MKKKSYESQYGKIAAEEQNKVLPQEAGVYTVLIPIQQSQRPWTNMANNSRPTFPRRLLLTWKLLIG